MSEAFEMGWNDVIGNIKRASVASAIEKERFARRVIGNNIHMQRNDKEYVRGACEAALAFLEEKPIPYIGPKWVIEQMESIDAK